MHLTSTHIRTSAQSNVYCLRNMFYFVLSSVGGIWNNVHAEVLATWNLYIMLWDSGRAEVSQHT